MSRERALHDRFGHERERDFADFHVRVEQRAAKLDDKTERGSLMDEINALAAEIKAFEVPELPER